MCLGEKGEKAEADVPIEPATTVRSLARRIRDGHKPSDIMMDWQRSGRIS